ncbi:hypothetical protein SmJEL517_g01930 [Synchytrium microbalum]|uniref:EGF-like domain-containing protein n=1 Tax=Synchytrium microbalum TaxID=1806994 RepID=A0A507C9A0_9FUNG|nr:uncharacterized protein SmJEL517_g01930 [Synchytrium microbalum]TPX35749.1 hypothetical protein SmJEL517_g01930 [Synchytrium microbalum]
MAGRALLLALLTTSLVSQSVASSCSHDQHLQLFNPASQSTVRTETRLPRMSKRDVVKSPIRIFLDYRYLWTDLNVTTFNTTSMVAGTNVTTVVDPRVNITNKLNIVSDWFGNVLNVTAPVSGNLTIDRSWCISALPDSTLCNATSPSYVEQCGVVTIPDDHFGDFTLCAGDATNCTVIPGGLGVAADTILYLSSKNTSICAAGATLSHGSYCRMNQFDRPIVGSLNLCPLFWGLFAVDNDTWITSEAVSNVIHETSHILAFSSSLFPFYRTQGLIPRTPRDALGMPPVDVNGKFIASNTTLQVFQERNANVTKLVLPNMLAKARSHFGCGTLNGVELENQGDSLIAGSHLEKRIYGPDYMTGSTVPGIEPDFNDISLAAFQDSGWYAVNYDYAINSAWGLNKGCSFATDSCLSTPSNTSAVAEVIPVDAASFCNSTQAAMTCVAGRFAKGICGMSNTLGLGSVPKNMQWFDGIVAPDSVNATGGVVELMDYCPTYIPTGDFQSGRSNSDCRNLFNLPNSDALESFDPSARCMASSLTLNPNVTQDYQPICYPVICSNDAQSGLTTYLITVNGSSIQCGVGNITVTVPGTSGNISCPPVTDLCFVVPQQCVDGCSGHGRCLGAQAPQTCVCKPGWTGFSCNTPSWGFTPIQYPPQIPSGALVPGVTDINFASPAVATATGTYAATMTGTAAAATATGTGGIPATLPINWVGATSTAHVYESSSVAVHATPASLTGAQETLSATAIVAVPANIVFASPNGQPQLNNNTVPSSPVIQVTPSALPSATTVKAMTFTTTVAATAAVTTTYGMTPLTAATAAGTLTLLTGYNGVPASLTTGLSASATSTAIQTTAPAVIINFGVGGGIVFASPNGQVGLQNATTVVSGVQPTGVVKARRVRRFKRN